MFAIDIHCCMAGFQCSKKKWCQCPDDIARGVQGTPFFSCLIGTRGHHTCSKTNLISVTPSLHRWTFPWWSMTVRQSSVFKPSTLRSLRMASCWKLTSWKFCTMALHRIPMAQSTALSWEFDIPLFGYCSATCELWSNLDLGRRPMFYEATKDSGLELLLIKSLRIRIMTKFTVQLKYYR